VILDEFELALPAIENEKNKEGIQMLYKKFVKILADYGLEPIECIGKKFDPNFHAALCRERCGEKTDTILEDLGKGYRLKSRVIRPSKVKIAEQISEEKGD
jgi:molecular chaperone GrpE